MQEKIRKSLPHIPTHKGNQPMKYIHIHADENAETITRSDFFSLTSACGDPCGHTWIDTDSMTTYFMDAVTEEQADLYRDHCAELDRQNKREQRNHACVYARTAKCTGWKEGIDHCRSCPNFEARLTEADAPATDDGAGYLDLYADPDALNPEEEAVRGAERLLLQEMLLTLSAEDRDLVLSRHVRGQGFIEIGERLGISQTYARTKCDRVLRRLEKNFRKDFE